MLVIAGFAEHLFGIWAASCAENDKAMLSVSISKQAGSPILRGIMASTIRGTVGNC